MSEKIKRIEKKIDELIRRLDEIEPDDQDLWDAIDNRIKVLKQELADTIESMENQNKVMPKSYSDVLIGKLVESKIKLDAAAAKSEIERYKIIGRQLGAD